MHIVAQRSGGSMNPKKHRSIISEDLSNYFLIAGIKKLRHILSRRLNILAFQLSEPANSSSCLKAPVQELIKYRLARSQFSPSLQPVCINDTFV